MCRDEALKNAITHITIVSSWIKRQECYQSISRYSISIRDQFYVEK